MGKHWVATLTQEHRSNGSILKPFQGTLKTWIKKKIKWSIEQ